MVFFMPNINISGNLAVSRDVFSRLQSRGLLDTAGSPTEDFILFIQEALARDLVANNNFISYQPMMPDIASVPITSIKDSITKEPEAENSVEEKPKHTPAVDLSALTSSLNELYGR